jgi:hypothetical protein
VVSLDDVPTLTLDEGLASLRWTFSPTVRSVGAAVAALASVRDRSPAPVSDAHGVRRKRL